MSVSKRHALRFAIGSTEATGVKLTMYVPGMHILTAVSDLMEGSSSRAEGSKRQAVRRSNAGKRAKHAMPAADITQP